MFHTLNLTLNLTNFPEGYRKVNCFEVVHVGRWSNGQIITGMTQCAAKGLQTFRLMDNNH